jgi:hypothetical protein
MNARSRQGAAASRDHLVSNRQTHGGVRTADKKCSVFAGAEPYFDLVRKALVDLVDGVQFFDIGADDIIYEVRDDLG